MRIFLSTRNGRARCAFERSRTVSTGCSIPRWQAMTEEIRNQIASRLRLARETAGLSQGQVAKMMNVHRPTISEIEAARRRVSADELARFAEIYGVSVSWLTGEQKAESEPVEDRIMLAARLLGKMKDEDLDRLMNVLRMLRKSGDSE